MKIGFIGSGNMAQAIIKGMIQQHYTDSQNIYLSSYSFLEAEQVAKELNVQALPSNQELVQTVDILVLAVKPNVIETVLRETQKLLGQKNSLVISIAAGKTLEQLAGYTPQAPTLPIIRVMPNMNAAIGASVSAVCGNPQTSLEQITMALELFQSVGTAYHLPEKDFSNFTALAGSAPAYAFLFIDALSRAGVKHGLAKHLATEIATQTVLGSAQMLLESEETPWDLIDKVCSPGGTTIAGLVALEDEGFLSTVIKGIDATIAKDIDLAQE